MSNADSLSSFVAHHYSLGYNFVVRAKEVPLCTEIPSQAQMLAIVPDSVYVYEGDDLVVADFAIVSGCGSDSVWVKVARDQDTQGWVREQQLLSCVSPDDPISVAIYKLGSDHVAGTLCLLGVVFVTLVFYILRMRRCDTKVSLHHFFVERLSLCSPYPTLLRVTLSGAAVFYVSIQQYAPQVWMQFYFYPTLNPFAVPALLSVFLFSLWLIVIFFIATIDDCLRQLSLVDSFVYMLVTITVLVLLYVTFSMFALVYVEYALYGAFVFFSGYRYFKYLSPKYRCGHCGKPMHRKGVCARCESANK